MMKIIYFAIGAAFMYFLLNSSGDVTAFINELKNVWYGASDAVNSLTSELTELLRKQ